MNNMFIFAFLLSFILCFLFMNIFIPLFKKRRVGQFVREEGPKEHLIKTGTPIFGGVIIFFSCFLSYIFCNLYYKCFEVKNLVLIFIPLLCFMLIGFSDDFLKIRRKNNEGLSPKQKLIFQLLALLTYYVILEKYNILSTKIYLFRNVYDIKYFYPVLFMLIFMSSTNALNLSDGIDGLASGLMIITLIAYGVIAFILKEGILLISIVCLVASILSFFIFNCNPARIFMGDSGSLMLGGALAMYAVLLKTELLLLLIGLPYLIETLSVIIQVAYFKITKGKRLFLMSPLHHHFELKGYSEWKIDLIFWVFGIIVSIISIVFVYLR